MCTVKMNAETAAWGRRYRTALRRCLASGAGTSLAPALRLGRRAVTLGMETLDVVRIHEQEVAALASSGDASGNLRETVERAKAFFAETIVPIEKTHRAALEAGVRVSRLTRTLRRRMLAATATDRRLKEGVRRRQTAEAALKKSESCRTRRLAAAQRLQKRLRRLMRDILSAQENERRKTSRHLHDDISQALLGIHVRLLTLKTAAEDNSENLQKEIDDTKRLVEHFKTSFHGRTRTFKGDHET